LAENEQLNRLNFLQLYEHYSAILCDKLDILDREFNQVMVHVDQMLYK
jgi:hypothetical protein